MESRILHFITALRNRGVRVSLAESQEAFSAVDLMGIHDRERFRLALRATLVKEARDLAAFDELFPLFFDSSQPPLPGSNALEGLSPAEAGLLAEALRQLTRELGDLLERVLRGEPLSQEQLDRLAGQSGLDRANDPRTQEWMIRRMLRLMQFPEVRESLQELLDMLARLGMDPGRLERMEQQFGENLQGLEDQVRAYARRRLTDSLGQPPPQDLHDSLLNRPLESLSEGEKKLLQQEVRRLAAALRTRIALRQKRARSGQLDPRATLRANLKYQGVPMELRYRSRVRKPRIVVLCDVSTSMRFCSELMLGFLFALQGQVHRTYAFAFIDHLESISGDFTGADANRAIRSVLERMPGGFYNTDLGWSLKDFSEGHLDLLNPRTTLLIVGDGRNNYNDPRLDLFSQLSRRAARTIWLNPEAPAQWHGDSDMPRYAPLCTRVLKVGTLRELAGAVDQLLSN
jgi:uncharacterized protein